MESKTNNEKNIGGVDTTLPLSAFTNACSVFVQFTAKASFPLLLILLDTDERYDGDIRDIRPGEDNGIPVTTNNSQLHETDTTYTALENPRHHK